jgi:long-chain acyl-CoA synthetase
MNIAQNVERGCCFFANKPALIFEDRAYSYRDLDEMVNRAANGLRGLGIRRGDRVALLLPNIPEFVISYLGIQKIGAIAVSINVMLVGEEIEFILNDCSATSLITTPELWEKVCGTDLPYLKHTIIAGPEEAGKITLAGLMSASSPQAAAEDMERDDPAAIVYSSGTTGFPKGATLSHGNVTSNMYAKNHYCGMTPDDRMLLFMPLFHCFGQNAILNSGLNAGSTIVLHRTFDLDRVLHSISRHKVTMFFGVPTIYIIMLNQQVAPVDLQSVRYCLSAAATMPTEIARQWQERFGVIINEGYGLTESSPFASYNHPIRYKYGSIGMPIENVEMRILDLDSGEKVAPGELGEIVIRGPNVMLGYWNRPEATAEAIREGWLHTGDIGRMDEQGYFYIEERLKDMINVAGLKVYPAEVENVLYRHPAVAEAAVYGVPDAITGERVEAQVVCKPGHSVAESELLALCRRHSASFKIPSVVQFVDRLPKSATGKILKRVLREEQSQVK